MGTQDPGIFADAKNRDDIEKEERQTGNRILSCSLIRKKKHTPLSYRFVVRPSDERFSVIPVYERAKIRVIPESITTALVRVSVWVL